MLSTQVRKTNMPSTLKYRLWFNFCYVHVHICVWYEVPVISNLPGSTGFRSNSLTSTDSGQLEITWSPWQLLPLAKFQTFIENRIKGCLSWLYTMKPKSLRQKILRQNVTSKGFEFSLKAVACSNAVEHKNILEDTEPKFSLIDFVIQFQHVIFQGISGQILLFSFINLKHKMGPWNPIWFGQIYQYMYMLYLRWFCIDKSKAYRKQ